jgi:membrane protease YdiL (CAAX protease family)
MSTAPSSVPPPSFDLAPELPEGIERPPPPERPGWKPWTAWVALLGAFGGALIGALIVGVIGALAGADFAHPPPAVNISATVVQDVAFVGAALLFASMAGTPRPEQFGLRRTSFWPAVGWIVIAFVGFYVVTLVWVSILGASPDDTKLPDELGVKDSTAAMLAVAFLVSVVAPVAEEFFFRGFFFTALRGWKGLWPAAILTGLVFGAIHIGSAEAVFLVPLAFFGFALCLLYHRTGSLYPCMALHCMNNSLAFGVSQHWGWETVLLFVSALSVISLGALAVRARWTPAPAPAG